MFVQKDIYIKCSIFFIYNGSINCKDIDWVAIDFNVNPIDTIVLKKITNLFTNQ